ncbi:hypothetical protein [Methanonatronarchaeum sp. AMET6-2]|uniref:hypothetical protein n=1 Tax=Methanonatronarchaeum sp. AMET6-2 TaxID=2933293 RepID=UPI00120B7F0E|nr:hypothetical protein [Methanonatronarchaeum sp. AMET6-2]RZN60552.1 MAG: hypothetical protein EF811_06480 [Methanonatronarchaeia archaeon]UOY10457.1 hypothetical protein MU439_02150 [Methanonatronarchaeum sp. AMET6-2]
MSKEAILKGMLWGVVFASIVIASSFAGYFIGERVTFPGVGIVIGTLTGFLITVALSFKVFQWHVKKRKKEMEEGDME